MNKRRQFIKTAFLLGMAPYALSNTHVKDRPFKSIRPKRLKKGDTVGLVAPASSVLENESIRMAMDVIRSMGLKVKPGKHLFERKGYLAGEDANRAKDLNGMFADSSVDAIFCLRGGYGSARMLPMIDYKNIAKNPKILLGYSDITALLNAIHLHTGLVTFHGPMPTGNYSTYSYEALKSVIMNPKPRTQLAAAPEFEPVEGQIDRDNRLVRIREGKARGKLIGGNLSLITKLMGTPYEPDFKDAILVLEDVNEKPYRIDGMLTHLWLTGKLKDMAGIAMGKWSDCDPEDPNSLTLETVFGEWCEQFKIPAVRGLMYGHVKDNATLPIGCEAELDATAGTLTLTEPSVS